MRRITRGHIDRNNVDSLAVMGRSSKKQLDPLEQVGSNIRAIRQEQGLSQEALALKADLDRSYLGGVERGERNISIINLKKIADALEVDAGSLLNNI